MSIPRYPKYKDSGVEWLDELKWHERHPAQSHRAVMPA
jgi:hypothetical protein